MSKEILHRGVVASVIVILVLVIDQILKIYIKTHFALGEIHPMFSQSEWANLLFVENKGMAFGMDVMGGTILLCMFRIFAVAFLVYALWKLIRNSFHWGFVICLSFVLAGAAGNIFDNVFYGAIFTESTPWQVAQFVPFGEGYSTFFTGKVVDMFYFPLIRTTYPDWVPIIGGEPFIFFSPIFNFADASISCGAAVIVLFYRRALQQAFNLFNTQKDEESSHED